MKSKLIVAIMLLLAAVSFSSCRKAAINGDLDGQWQLMTIDEPDGSVVAPQRTYYCLYLHTVNLIYPGGMVPGNMTYEEKARKLTIEFPTVDLTKLAPLGIVSNPVVFDIRQLSHQNMVLEADGKVLTFRKF